MCCPPVALLIFLADDVPVTVYGIPGFGGPATDEIIFNKFAIFSKRSILTNRVDPGLKDDLRCLSTFLRTGVVRETFLRLTT
jgi:hypothetical protein